MKKVKSVGKANSEETWQCNKKKEIVGGKIIQCMEENPLCNNFFYFGSAIFCKKTVKNEPIQTNGVKHVPPIINMLKKERESF